MAGRKSTKSKAPAQPEGKPAFSLISNGKLTRLYSAMIECRLLEKRARNLYAKNGRQRNRFSLAAQEASIVGIALDLKRSDTIACSHYDLPTGFLQGKTLKKIFAGLRANAADPQAATASSSIAAAQLKAAIRSALAHRKKKSGKVVVIFLNNGSASSEALEEALRLAGLESLPVLFVHRSNRHAIAGKSKQRADEDLFHKAQSSRIPVIPVDAQDVVAVYRVASEAIARARLGRGPTLIECLPWTVAGHKSAAAKSRAGKKAARDPIRNMEAYLDSKGLFTAGMKRAIVQDFNRRLDSATQSAQISQ